MMGDAVTLGTFFERMMCGQIDTRELGECWIMLLDGPRLAEELRWDENLFQYEIPEDDNYTAGGVRACEFVFVQNDKLESIDILPTEDLEIRFVRQVKPLLDDNGNLLQDDPPDVQKPCWALIYEHERMLPIYAIDLGGPMDMRRGDLTLNLSKYPNKRYVPWWRRNWLFGWGNA